MSIKRGVELYEQGKYRESIKEFKKVLKAQRNNRKVLGESPLYSSEIKVVWNNIANAYASAGKFRRAEMCYINALKCDYNPKLTKDRGLICYNYAYMLFFFKLKSNGDLVDVLKSYLLFKAAHSYGIENAYWKTLQGYLFSKDLMLTIIPNLMEDRLWLRVLKNRLLADITPL